MAVKRMKNELDRKLEEQEEELDEQAGVIQQLEQVQILPCEQLHWSEHAK